MTQSNCLLTYLGFSPDILNKVSKNKPGKKWKNKVEIRKSVKLGNNFNVGYHTAFLSGYKFSNEFTLCSTWFHENGL